MNPSVLVRWRVALFGAIALVLALAAAWTLRPRPSDRAPSARADAQPRQLTFSGDVEAIALSPDGETLAYLAHDKLRLRALATGSETIALALPDDRGRRVQWSRDGARVLIGGGQEAASAALVVAIAGGAATTLANALDFDAVKTSEQELALLERARQVFPLESRGAGKLSSNARVGRVAFLREERRSQLWRVPLGGAEPHASATPIVAGTAAMADSPAISPDGRTLAFRAGSQDDANICTQPIEGGRIHQLTSSRAQRFSPVWSPDGGQLAYLSNEGGAWRVWVVNADGTHAHALHAAEVQVDARAHWLHPSADALSWAPAPRIVYFGGHPPAPRALAPSGDRDEAIDLGKAAGSIARALAGPAGRIAVRRFNDALDAPSALWLIDAKAGTQVRLAEGLEPLAFSADGSELAATPADHNTDARTILRVPTAGGAPQPLLTLPLESPAAEVALAPEGQYAVAAVMETRADVWLLDSL